MADSKAHGTAFIKGLRFFQKGKTANDDWGANGWGTINGAHVYRDPKTGELQGAVGKAIQERARAKAGNSALASAGGKQSGNNAASHAGNNPGSGFTHKAQESKKKIDFSRPEKIPKEHILQNRDRSSPTSIQQMNAIANNPDFARMSGSNEFGAGAPVVAYGDVPENQLGRFQVSVLSDGTRVKTQYAVVEGDSVLTSNNVAGQSNSEYYGDDASKMRAIAGNGRMTGVTEAYRRGKADTYRKEMMDEAESYGLDPEAVRGMKNPVLVRVMQTKDVTSDIGDRSNTSGNLVLNAVENAMQDITRYDVSKTKYYANGMPTVQSIAEFASKMPISEQGMMIDKDGNPTTYAESRLKAAIMQKAYGDGNITRMYSQALSPEGKNLLNGLMRASSDMLKLEGKADGLDVRGLVAQAVEHSMDAIRAGRPLDVEASQMRMVGGSFGGNRDDDFATNEIIKMFAQNRNSGAKIGEKLSRMAQTLLQEAEARESEPFDMFGDIPKRNREDLVREALAKDANLFRRKMSLMAWDHWQKNGAQVVKALLDGSKYDRKFFSLFGRKK